MAYGGAHLGGGFGGKVSFAANAAAPSLSSGTQPYKAGGGQTGGSNFGEVSPVLIGMVIVEAFALVSLRRMFRNYHGG